MAFNGQRFFFILLMGSGLVLAPSTHVKAQDATQSQAAPAAKSSQEDPNSPDFDPRKRQRSDRERYKAQRELRQELKGTYKTWLNQEVTYIISDQERKAFMSLGNDEERDAFIEAFWQRRNPNPDSPENEFREEHYRRIQYANDHFAAGKPGWKTDRGHVYISFGKPDDIESHPSGGTYQRPQDEGGGTTSTFPFEIWHYRYIEGIGENVNLEFVDTCQCGDFHFTIDRSEKDALLMVPGAGLTQWEEMNHKDKTDRFKGGQDLAADSQAYTAGKLSTRINHPMVRKVIEAFAQRFDIAVSASGEQRERIVFNLPRELRAPQGAAPAA